MAMDFRNYQLLTSGYINQGTSIIVDTNYDTSFEIFHLFMFNVGMHGNATLAMIFNGDNSMSYFNRENYRNGILLTSVANDLMGFMYALEITIYWPLTGPGAFRTSVIGQSSYDNTGSAQPISYNIAGTWAFAPVLPTSFIRIFDVNGVTFDSGRYVLYGVNGRGASLLSTSTQGG
jgi:hypothetical protein